MIPLKGLQKTTLIDYPGKIACTVSVGGCNFRCGYCHNADLALNHLNMPSISEGEFFSWLGGRKKYLDGVCVTGGEPTLYQNLTQFCQKIKVMGLMVKLDTNGTNPDLLKELIEKKVIDYIAMDIKTSFDKYSEVAGVNVDISKLRKSIQLIKNSGIRYEFRTTVIPDKVHAEEMKKISLEIGNVEQYFLQNFKASTSTIEHKYHSMEPAPDEEMDSLMEIIVPISSHVSIR